jgi:hypothetical protein
MEKKKDGKKVELTRKVNKKTEEKKIDNKKPEGQVDFSEDKQGRLFVTLTQDKIRLTLPIELMLSFAQLSSLNKKVGFSIDENNVATIVVDDVGINLDVPALQMLGNMCMKALISKQQEALAKKRILTPDDLMKMSRNNSGNNNKGGGRIII